ncbi:hypothetical protein LSAT2_027506 [Lamellibrachia satsuma]|nr:hypothetical protein LSAT2_027506 [Lamellibrachia satsuma]
MQEKLDPMHFAYKRGRSTDDAVATLLHNVTKHLEKAGNYIRIPVIYFNSAFNTMQPHKDRWVTDEAQLNDDAAPETNEYNEYVDRSKLFGFWFDTTSALRSSYLPGLIPKVTHVHEYKEGVDDFSVFDVSACYVQRKWKESSSANQV